MTLGDKSALSSEVKDIYSITGASHVLALSGLHLGIIYMLLSILLAHRRRFWLSQVVIILSIWAFAVMTGLSTSIVRSATMISIYGLLSVAGRNKSSLNVLCFTAILMLLFSPTLLFEVGFQLSFMAVLSILLFMPLVERMVPSRYMIKYPLVRWLWSAIAVSMSAQIGVAPLIAYYFGRLSTYFLLTNLFVLPLATVILYGALLFLITSWSLLGSALFTVVTLLNRGLSVVASLPLSSIDGLHPSVFQVCMMYTIIICIYIVWLRLLPPSRKY
jgi:competence protein ComEC